MVEKETNGDDLIYKTGNKKTYDFQKFKTIRSVRYLEGRQKGINSFEIKIFPIGKQTQGKVCTGMLALRPLDLACVAKVSDPAQLKTQPLNKRFKDCQ